MTVRYKANMAPMSCYLIVILPVYSRTVYSEWHNAVQVIHFLLLLYMPKKKQSVKPNL